MKDGTPSSFPPDEETQAQKSSKYCMMHQPQDILAEMRPSTQVSPHVLVARDVDMDYRLHCRMCNVPTEQEHHSLQNAPHCIASPTSGEALPFQQIALDLITGLPPNGPHDSVLMIVDHGCSHAAAVFLPCANDTNPTGPWSGPTVF